jgi:hypothetical protein
LGKSVVAVKAPQSMIFRIVLMLDPPSVNLCPASRGSLPRDDTKAASGGTSFRNLRTVSPKTGLQIRKE